MTIVYVVSLEREYAGHCSPSYAGTDRDQAFGIADKVTRDEADTVHVEVWSDGKCIEQLKRPCEHGTSRALVYERSILSASGGSWQDAPSYERTLR